MSKLLIITYPDPILRRKSQSVENVLTDSIQRLIQQMTEILIAEKGLGLAAPQVGQNIRLVLINTKDKMLVLINPRIRPRSIARELGEEGCLSVPGVYGLVKRWKKIKVTAQDQRGQKIQLMAEGLLARVIQHEVDHLNGILFITKVTKITQGQENLKS